MELGNIYMHTAVYTQARCVEFARARRRRGCARSTRVHANKTRDVIDTTVEDTRLKERKSEMQLQSLPCLSNAIKGVCLVRDASLKKCAHVPRPRRVSCSPGGASNVRPRALAAHRWRWRWPGQGAGSRGAVARRARVGSRAQRCKVCRRRGAQILPARASNSVPALGFNGALPSAMRRRRSCPTWRACTKARARTRRPWLRRPLRHTPASSSAAWAATAHLRAASPRARCARACTSSSAWRALPT